LRLLARPVPPARNRIGVHAKMLRQLHQRPTVTDQELKVCSC
jgi:hypothetical protein